MKVELKQRQSSLILFHATEGKIAYQQTTKRNQNKQDSQIIDI